MPQLVTTFDPSAAAKGQFTIPQSAANGKIVIYNESNISLQFLFQDGSSDYVPAWCAVLICHEWGSVIVTWAQKYTLSSSSPPLSQVVVVTYAQGEHVPGSFPAALARQVNMGNAIPVSTSTNAIVNDGNAANTSIVEATQIGSSGSNVSLDNSGNMFLKQYVSATLTTIFQTIAGATAGASNVKLSDSNHAAEIVGQLLCDELVKVADSAGITATTNRLLLGGSTSGDVLDATSEGFSYIKGGTNIVLQVPNGTTILQVDGTGIRMPFGESMQWGNGADSLSQTHRFTGTGSGTYSHGCHAAPFAVCPVCSVTGSTQTEGAGSVTLTQVTVTTGAGLAFWAFCAVG